ncbi:MAG TPA: DUF3108 domain-containing protein [Amoebophilaceae bacterium]|nr:DUF3108 domain-containing protein [Amoebophilaceae bacterium]
MSISYPKKEHDSFFLILLALLLSLTTPPVCAKPTVEPPFRRGEYLEYQVYYSIVHAGTAIMSVDEALHEIDNRTCYKIDVQGISNDALALCGFKVKDTWETYLDVEQLRPRKFLAHIQENNYVRKECIDFDYKKNQARIEVLENTPDAKPEISYYPIPDAIKDLVSGYYALRSIDIKRLKPGDALRISVLHENKMYPDVSIQFLGKRTIATKLGKISSLVFAPMVPTENSIFAGERPVEIFISDDVNKIPLKLKANLVLGAVEIELSNYKGLKAAIPFQKP